MRLVTLVLLSAGSVSFGHRLDEYLQATIFSIETNRVQATLQLTPGVAVFQYVINTIDTDHDGVISKAEETAYAGHVLADLSLSLNGDRLPLQLISVAFPKMEQMKEGLADIQIDFAADVSGSGLERKLVFENRHQSPIATYLVNTLVPRDPTIKITSQQRNYEQSLYQLDYVQAGVGTGLLSLEWWSAVVHWQARWEFSYSPG